MVVTPEGRFLTQREWPTLAVVQPVLGTDDLELRAPGRGEVRLPLRRARGETRRVRVWDDECEAWDEGPEAARLLSEHLGTSVRLVRMADAFVRAVESGSDRSAQTGFADAFPLLVLSEASLEELNRRLAARGATPVPMGRFRPNVVLAGCPAFAEDEWKSIRVGPITLDLVKACVRCVTPTVDQASGSVPDPREPLATLATFRRRDGGVVFGQNAVHREPGWLSVGDLVTPVERTSLTT